MQDSKLIHKTDLTFKNWFDTIFVTLVALFFATAFGMNLYLAIFLDLLVIYLLSIFFFKRYYFYEDYIKIYYPLRFFKRYEFVKYSDIKKVRYSLPHGNLLTLSFSVKNKLNFSYQNLFENNMIPILKLMKKKGVRVQIAAHMRDIIEEIKKFNPETDEIKF